MTQPENYSSQHLSPGKRILVGAAIGLLLISYFILSVDKPDPAWGKLWMIQPLIIVPLAGAMAGLCNYFIMQYHNKFGVNRIIAIIISVIVSLIGLWLGIVLGLNGTLWN